MEVEVDLDKLLMRVREAKKSGQALSIAYHGNVVELWEKYEMATFYSRIRQTIFVTHFAHTLSFLVCCLFCINNIDLDLPNVLIRVNSSSISALIRHRATTPSMEAITPSGSL